MATLISMEEFQQVLGMKCEFNGHVWDTNGKLFRVSTVSDSIISTSPDHPYERHRGYGKNDKFHTSTRKTTITLEEIEGDDIVFDENGNYVCVKPDANSVKGEIFIRKQIHKGPMAVFEDIPLEGSRLSLSLTPEAYSKIFTYILNLDQKIGNYLKNNIRNGQVSVQYLSTPETYHNMTKDERESRASYANASSNSSTGIIIAIITPGGNKDMYATIWNVINLLGMHEMGHVIHPWWGDFHKTHHLNYVYQMGHHSWEHTTKYFQDKGRENLEYYYDRYKEMWKNNPEELSTRERLRKYDFYPRKGEEDNIYDFVDRTKKSIQDYWSVRRRSLWPSTYNKKN